MTKEMQQLADMVAICSETGGDIMAMLADAGIECEEIEILADSLLESEE